MKDRITDILARFLFSLWVISGIFSFVCVLVGLLDAALPFAMFFVGMIILSLLYALVKWIVTGDS